MTVIGVKEKEKMIFDLAHLFLSNISQLLTNQNVEGLSDLILDKSQLFFELSNMSNWPATNNIKIQNLHRLAIFVYNHLKIKYTLELNDYKNQDLLKKALESIANFFENIFENNNYTFFSDDLLLFFFQDLFEFYNRNRKANPEEADEFLSLIKETLNILDEELSRLLLLT